MAAGKENEDNLFGKIESVFCKHFVTYEEVIYRPGEFLNILIGPNGTGKSTIVSAIVLGLGGEPPLLNRSNSINEYIKNGKQSATIIIKIYGRNGKLVAFCRKFTESNESIWHVNSEAMNKKKFLSVIATFNIQISNLCQFLPQDRVQDFLKMNAHELLDKTLGSVCDQQLIDEFNQLKALQKEQLISKHIFKSNMEKLEKIKIRLEQLQVAVNEFNEYNEYHQKVKVYNAKRVWLEVDEIKMKAAEHASDLASATQLYEVQKNTYDNLMKNQEDIIKMTDKLKKEIIDKNNLKMKVMEEIKKYEAANLVLYKEIREGKTYLQQVNSNNFQNEEDLRKETQMLETILNDLYNIKEQIVEDNVIKARHEKKLQELKEIINRDLQRRVDINKILDDVYLPEIHMIENKMARLENVVEQRLQMLSTQNPNLVKAVHWLNDNKSMFSEKVYNPMVLELNVPDAQNAKYFENTIKIRDLLAFTCVNKTDMSLLINELCIKQKLGVNVVYSAAADHVMYSPQVSIDKIKCYGFTAFMANLVEGPAPIINKLCSLYNIHNIPIGCETVSNYTNSIPSHIRQYFGGCQRYSVTTSRYRSDNILTESYIKGKNLLSSVNTTEVPSLRIRLSVILKKTDALKNERSKIEANIVSIEHQRKSELEAKLVIDAKCKRKEQIMTDYVRQQKKVADLQKQKISISDMEQQFKLKVSQNEKKIFEHVKKGIGLLQTAEQRVIETNKATAKEVIYKNQCSTQINYINEVKKELCNKQKILDTINNTLETIKKNYKAKVSEAMQLSNNCKPTDTNFQFKEEFVKLSKLDMVQIKELLFEEEARLECLGAVNQEAVNEFKDLSIKLEELQKKVITSQNEDQDIEKSMCTIYDKWIPEISKLIQTISQQFSDFMNSISCTGEVLLSNREKFDFDSYGIEVMVQYRKNQPLQTLDKHLQSGGERAVAIAIYTLSLQHITRVPFRCVDEINQGMDPKNERSILNMLLAETTKIGSSQYLFVTPKLPRNLNYNERVNVSVVHNGSFMHCKDFAH